MHLHSKFMASHNHFHYRKCQSENWAEKIVEENFWLEKEFHYMKYVFYSNIKSILHIHEKTTDRETGIKLSMKKWQWDKPATSWGLEFETWEIIDMRVLSSTKWHIFLSMKKSIHIIHHPFVPFLFNEAPCQILHRQQTHNSLNTLEAIRPIKVSNCAKRINKINLPPRYFLPKLVNSDCKSCFWPQSVENFHLSEVIWSGPHVFDCPEIAGYYYLQKNKTEIVKIAGASLVQRYSERTSGTCKRPFEMALGPQMPPASRENHFSWVPLRYR